MANMEIEYTLTEADILALAKHRWQSMPTLRHRLRIRRLSYIVGFTLLALGTWLLLSEIILPVMFLVLAVISFLLFPIYHEWHIRRSVSQAYRDEKKRATLATRTLRATDEGLEEESQFGEVKLKWNVIDDITVTPSHTFISVERVPSLVIPKDQVKTEDYEAFIKACRSQIEDRAGFADQLKKPG